MRHKLNQEYHYQQLNGLTDWFSDAVDYASDKVSDAALWVTEGTGTTSSALALSEKLDEQASELSTSFKNKLVEFQNAMDNLFIAQEKVDEAIESLPEGPDKQRLSEKRAESRGVFSRYILPAWNQFKDWAGYENDANYSGMGLAITGTMIITAGAVVTAVSIALPYIYSSYKIEQSILKDPSLAKTYVASRGSLFSLGPIPGYIAMGAAGLGALYLFKTFKGKA